MSIKVGSKGAVAISSADKFCKECGTALTKVIEKKGEGKITRVKSRNLWRRQLQHNGEKYDIYGKTEKEVEEKTKDIIEKVEAGIDPKLKDSVAQYFESWYPKGRSKSGNKLLRIFEIFTLVLSSMAILYIL